MKINKCPLDNHDVLNWSELNNRFIKREQAYADLNKLLTIKKTRAISLAEKENLYKWECWKTFNQTFDLFVKNNVAEIEENNGNFIVDFEECSRNQDDTFNANIWIQPLIPNVYRPHTGKFRELIIVGLLIESKISFLERSHTAEKIVRFELFGHYQPMEWRGRNELDYQTVGNTISTGFNRLILVEAMLFDLDFLEKIKNEYSGYFFSAMRNYFL